MQLEQMNLIDDSEDEEVTHQATLAQTMYDTPIEMPMKNRYEKRCAQPSIKLQPMPLSDDQEEEK